MCGGTPIIKGTRVTLRTILASLEDGCTPKDIVAGFPSVGVEDIRAVIAFAAASAREDMPTPGVTPVNRRAWASREGRHFSC
ncbi:MAG: DUF433 domain-containing protein [Magnetococcales bacterium]|nr:DUF433 domain-containing protein [Magnetococcales bacterium]